MHTKCRIIFNGMMYQNPKFIIKKNAIKKFTIMNDLGTPKSRTCSDKDL